MYKGPRVNRAGVVVALITILGAAALTATETVTTASPAEAYTRLGCKFSGTNPALKYHNAVGNPAFWTATVAGAGRWNAVSVPGSFASTTGSTYNILVTEKSFVDPTVYAATTGTCSSGLWSGNLTVFTWATEGSGPLSATQKRMVATHELGHSYGLGHMTVTSCSGTKTVMVQGSLKWSCSWGTEPWADDIAGVNAIY